MMKETTISKVRARQLIDCKCRPMLEVDVETVGGALGRGSAPTGSSVGSHESFILRDNDPNEYNGLSVHKAVKVIETQIAPALIGMDVMDQDALDRRMNELDGTKEKKNLGGNSIYSVSIACARAGAAAQGVPLYRFLSDLRGGLKHIPLPTFNVINGGHCQGFIQPFNEFIIAPVGADNIQQAVEIGVRVFQNLSTIISNYQKGKPAQVGGSFGYVAPSADPEIVLDLISEAVDLSGYNDKVMMALDCASSEMYDKSDGSYLLGNDRVSAEELISYTKQLLKKHPMLFVEDLLDEDDWEGFVNAKKTLTNTNILGDDLIVTDPERLKKACMLNAVDGFILKPNQIGTISEALKTYDFATKNNLLAIPSGRSGGVVGDVIMDFSVGLNAPFQKNGAPRSGERIDKLNFLLRVADEYPQLGLADFSSIIK